MHSVEMSHPCPPRTSGGKISTRDDRKDKCGWPNQSCAAQIFLDLADTDCIHQSHRGFENIAFLFIVINLSTMPLHGAGGTLRSYITQKCWCSEPLEVMKLEFQSDVIWTEGD